MRCLLKSKTQSKGSVRVLGMPCCAWLFFLRSGQLRGRSCNQKVARTFWACRFTLLPAANADRSELLRVALSIDHCRAFETAFQTVLVGSRRRNIEIEAGSVIIVVPWWFRSCFRPRARRGRSAGSELRSAGPVVNRRMFETAFRTVLVRSRCRNFETRGVVNCPLRFGTGVNGVCRLSGLTDALPSEV